MGGTAAALHAGHRISYDHVIADLGGRLEAVLDALDREGDWVTNRVTPGKIILGELGGIETGLRQLIRRRPLETEQITVSSGPLTVPTLAEILRIKAFLVVKRNQARDYLDVAALSDRIGAHEAARVLAGIDDYYADQAPDQGTVAMQVAQQLADPHPRDARVTGQLPRYKGLDTRWQSWAQIVSVCREVAQLMLLGSEEV